MSWNRYQQDSGRSSHGWQSRGSGGWNEHLHQGSDPVYTKGACKNNGREGARGGIGVFWPEANDLNTSSTYSGRQTNQTASLEAATKGIEQAKAQNLPRVTVYSDNQLVTKGMNEWINKWKENDWKTSRNTDVVHKDHFVRLDEMTRDMDVDWKYVPARSKGGNAEAHKLAREAYRK
ncbi:ribonuclease H1-like [Gracilinanus agilis]|uniref:ribonuclease H1-like n=1 Tax=Gracilinanus agilis TaxID=191870 RepID=UPI001CFEBD30|nr:ribonuclease H1-like [Gracilinanus agilis]